MKNTIKLFGIIALAVIIGFTGCENGNGNDPNPNPDPNDPVDNPISGKTTWLYDASSSLVKITFSTTSIASGTYTLYGKDWGDYTEDPTWTSKSGEGNYTWSESAKTVTLTATKILTYNEDYELVLMTKSEMEAGVQDQVEADTEDEINYYLMEWDDDEGEMVVREGVTRDEAIEEWLEVTNEHLGTDYESYDDYIAGEVAKKKAAIAEMFAPSPYTYIFCDDDKALILLGTLPAPVGDDELKGEIFTLSDIFGMGGGDQSFTFASSGRTFTVSGTDPESNGAISASGSYSYNSTTKQVYIKVDTINGKTPEQFFDAIDDYDPENNSNNLPDENAHRTVETFQTFAVQKFIYDTDDNSLNFDLGY